MSSSRTTAEAVLATYICVTMSRKELRERTIQVIDRMPDKALESLRDLLEQLNTEKIETDDEIIDRLIAENDGLLARLAK